MTEPLRILLVQARSVDDPMAQHELEAFASRCQLTTAHFSTFNIAVEDRQTFCSQGFDALMIGGSGAFSLVEGGFDWHADFLELMRTILNAQTPTFASCFGFQGIVQALGGKLTGDSSRAELGTFEISLTQAGESDPLFGQLPPSFDAQLGHNDSALSLTKDLLHLASSERCPYQAIRVRDRPIVATQFHPELTRSGNLDRFRNYLKNYKNPDHDFDQAMAFAERIHRPSPHASSLLQAFIADLYDRRDKASPTVLASKAGHA